MKITNTLTGNKEELQPVHPGEIRFYVCGPTVYDASHLGHARPIFVFDVLRRYLEKKGHRVTQVINVTDIDDKIIQRAAQQGVTTRDLSRKWEKDYWELYDRLGALRPHQAPRATDHIQDMVSLIEELVGKDLAYPSGSNVYYSVRKFKKYGRLSKRSLDDMMPDEGLQENAGPQRGDGRKQDDRGKRDPLDFALWKGKKEGDPSWPSPWGEGRPGWHIECSAMSAKYLGVPFDIHGGALDLVFPHHENEIAQSEGAKEREFARIWMHVGFLNVGGQKMSKSLGNVVSLRDILEKYCADILRLFFMQNHYRSPIDFSADRLDETAEAYERLEVYRIMMTRLLELSDSVGLSSLAARSAPLDADAEPAKELALGDKIADLRLRFEAAMDEDLNTAKALGFLFDFTRLSQAAILPWMQKGRLPGPDMGKILKKGFDFFTESIGVLGLFQEPVALSKDVAGLIKKREDAREKKDFRLGDRLRDEVIAKGYVLEDHPVLGTLVRPRRVRPAAGRKKSQGGMG